MSAYYTGIGSRETPLPVLSMMTRCAHRLSVMGWILRSGGAHGADAAFEAGTIRSEIYLPWPGFNNNRSGFHLVSPDALALAATIHPAFARLSQGAQKMMGRNCYQVLGLDLATPSDFVLCWTPDGAETAAARSGRTGGTGQAIALADARGIPVFNMFHTDALDRLARHLAIGKGAAIVGCAPATPPGVRVRTGRFESLRS